MTRRPDPGPKVTLTPPTQREAISRAHEYAECAAAAIARGDYLSADIILKLALDYLRDGHPELKEL